MLFATVAISLCGGAFAQQQSVKSFPSNVYSLSLDGQGEGIRYASDGNIYFASSSQSAHHGAAFFKFEPAVQRLSRLAPDITTICGEDPPTNPQGKIHATIQEMQAGCSSPRTLEPRTAQVVSPAGPAAICSGTGVWIPVGIATSALQSAASTTIPTIRATHPTPESPWIRRKNYIYVFATGEFPRQVSYVFRL